MKTVYVIMFEDDHQLLGVCSSITKAMKLIGNNADENDFILSTSEKEVIRMFKQEGEEKVIVKIEADKDGDIGYYTIEEVIIDADIFMGTPS